MNPSQGGDDGRVLSRRSVLGRIGGTAGIVAGTAGCVGDGVGGGGSQETTGGDETVTFGLTTPESGTYNAAGAEERRGFELAVKHLNNGGGLVGTDAMPQLSGNGVVGREVETVVHDTGGSTEQVEEISKSFERNDEIVMYTGGISGEIVRSLRDAANENGIPYMAGPTTLNSVTGSSCSKYVFRELYSATSLVRALGPVLMDNLRDDATYYHLTVDSAAGDDLEETFDTYLSNNTNWRLSGKTTTIPGSTDFQEQLQSAEGAVPDAVFLNLFGLDAANALNQATDIISSNIQIIVPYMDRTVAQTVSENIATVLGTVPWIRSINNDPSNAFEDAYQSEYGDGSGDDTPSGIAHHAYVQTLQYAAAAERAGSFDADEIRDQLDGHSYDVGLGDQTMRACDHQATRSVPIVRGRRASQQRNNRYLNLLRVADDVTPSCDEPPATDCSF